MPFSYYGRELQIKDTEFQERKVKNIYNTQLKEVILFFNTGSWKAKNLQNERIFS